MSTVTTAKTAATAPAAVDPKEVARKAAKKARKDSQKAARAVVVSALTDEKVMKNLPESLAAALKALFTVSRTGVASGTSLTDKINAMFSKLEVGKGVGELELFTAFKIGRGEMRKRVRELIRDAAPTERLWIAYEANADDLGTWILQGKGEKTPAGWKGYMPVEE